MREYDVLSPSRPIINKEGFVAGWFCVGQVEAPTVEDAIVMAKRNFPLISHPMVQPHIRLTKMQQLPSKEELLRNAVNVQKAFVGTKRVWR